MTEIQEMLQWAAKLKGEQVLEWHGPSKEGESLMALFDPFIYTINIQRDITPETDDEGIPVLNGDFVQYKKSPGNCVLTIGKHLETI